MRAEPFRNCQGKACHQAHSILVATAKGRVHEQVEHDRLWEQGKKLACGFAQGRAGRCPRMRLWSVLLMTFRLTQAGSPKMVTVIPHCVSRLLTQDFSKLSLPVSPGKSKVLLAGPTFQDRDLGGCFNDLATQQRPGRGTSEPTCSRGGRGAQTWPWRGCEWRGGELAHQTSRSPVPSFMSSHRHSPSQFGST